MGGEPYPGFLVVRMDRRGNLRELDFFGFVLLLGSGFNKSAELDSD
jgi:hypothetical protein